MGMYRQIEAQLIDEHPDYVEIVDLLALSAQTWPKFGLSISDLSEMDDYTIALIKVGV